MRHAILGNGNLGNSLAIKLLKNEHTVKVFSTSNGLKYPNSLVPLYDFIPDHVWVTIGAGSVEQAIANYLPFIDLHIRLPIELAQTLNSHITLHTFSTDYVIDNPVKSLYALSKLTMEQTLTLINRPKTYIYRVGSLYGTYKPHKSFPYKLKKAWIEKAGDIKLPLNKVTPTPTDWLADILIENLEKHEATNNPLHRIYNVAPLGCCSIKEWGELILNKKVEPKDFDTSRPENSNIGCNLPIHTDLSWLDLWKERENYGQPILDKMEE